MLVRSYGYGKDRCYASDQQQVISGSRGGTSRIWDIATTNCCRILEPARLAGSYADIAVLNKERDIIE